MMQEQVLSPQFSAATASGQYSSEDTFITQYDIKRFIKRYSTLIGVSALVGVLISGTYVLFAVPLYTAHTQIIIDPSLPQALQPNSESIFSIDNAQVESQIEVLKSEKIAAVVIDQLSLENNAEFGGDSRPWIRLPWRMSHAESVADAFARERSTLARFQESLSVLRGGLSYAIDILFTSQNAELAAKIANATANAYIAEQIDARAQAVRQSGQWLEERIDQIRQQMNKAALDAQEFRAKRDYRIAATDDHRKEGAGTPDGGNGVRLNTMEELDSTAQTYRRIYESYLMAYTESVQKQSYPVTNARVITAATPPLTKSHPKTKLILVFGGLMGCLAGLAVAFFRNRIDRSVWNPRQIREEVGIECLASIPRLPGRGSPSPFPRAMLAKAAIGNIFKAVIEHRSLTLIPGIEKFKTALLGSKSARLTRQAEAASAPERKGTDDGDVLDAVITMPFTSFSLAIKKLKTAISLAGRTRRIRCIAITSALPNEGKTTVAANLAMLFASSGVRTLLVDGDLRHGSLSRLLAPEAKFGLLDAIAGTVGIEQCIVQVRDTGLDLLPVAADSQAVHSDEILGSEKAQRFVTGLQEIYDFIIFELPPLTASLDGLTIGSMLDCTLLLAEWGKTSIPILFEAIHLLRNARVEILGVAINKADTSTIQYGDVATNYLSRAYLPAGSRLDRSVGIECPKSSR